ncbi:MAG: hypothetical protein ACOZBZ_00905 [Patescibacteria group bacterium]
MKKILNSLWLTTIGMAISATPVFAQIELCPKEEKWKPLCGITVERVVAAAIRFILVIAALAFFFMLVIGGIRWIVSGGDKAGTEAARNQITAALVGLVIIFVAWAIILLIKTLFGVDILQLTIPSI